MNFTSSFSILTTLLWVGVIALIVMSFLRSGQNRPIRRSGLYILVGILVAVVFTLTSMGIVFIEPNQSAVVISVLSPQGYREQALNSGLHWIIPGLESVVRYPVSKQTYTMSIAPAEGQLSGDDSIAARTSDGQEIFIDASVIYRLDKENIIQIHKDWQNRYADELVRPVSRAVIRDAVSQFGVEEVYSSKREELTKMILERMAAELNVNGLVIEQFLLRNITFSDEYAASVEQKQIAEQTAQQAKFVVEQRKQEAEQARQEAEGLADAVVIRAKGEAEARIIEAKAEAEALTLIAEAVKDRADLLTYQYITKLTPNIQAMLLPSNSPFLFPLPELQSEVVVEPTQTILPTVEPTPTTEPTP